MINGCRTVFKAPREVILEPQVFGVPGPGQALLRTECTLISTGTELNVLTGEFRKSASRAAQIQFPTGVGYSNVGTVLEVGPGVERVRVGDRAASMAAHASHAIYAADQLWSVPEGVDSEAAAFATLAEIVMGGLRRSRLVFGESAAIVGAGLLGQLAAHFCRAAGAWPVIVIDSAQQRLQTASVMGATHTLNMVAEEATKEVQRLTGGVDVVFEVTGIPSAIPGALKLARRLGRVVLVGSPRGSTMMDMYEEAHLLSLEIIGAHNSGHPPVETPHNPWTMARHVRLFLDWQKAGVIDVRPLITHRYPWQQTPEAYAMLLEDRTRALGVVLDWS